MKLSRVYQSTRAMDTFWRQLNKTAPNTYIKIRVGLHGVRNAILPESKDFARTAKLLENGAPLAPALQLGVAGEAKAAIVELDTGEQDFVDLLPKHDRSTTPVDPTIAAIHKEEVTRFGRNYLR